MLNTGDSPIPGQIADDTGQQLHVVESEDGHTTQHEDDLYVLPTIVDIPLHSLLNLTAFGRMHFEGTKLVGFSEEPEAVAVLKDLYDKKIIRIGQNVPVESAKDIFFVLEELARIGDKGSIVRFHCLMRVGDRNLDEVGVVSEIIDKKKSIKAANLAKNRTSILATGKNVTDESKTHRRARSVKFDNGESVVAVEAFIDGNLMGGSRRRMMTCFHKNCGIIALFIFGAIVALVVLLGSQS